MDAPATSSSIQLRTLSSGGYAAAKPAKPQATPALDEATYQRLWSSLIGNGDAPAVDFSRESVVFLLGGEKSTGGWTVVARGAKLEGDALVVDAAVQGPPSDAIVTQAFTSPYVVVAVNSKAFQSVRW